MHIEHVAIWTQDLERLRDFYEKYFEAKAGERYHNPKKNFFSYFLSFAIGPRLELMQMPDIADNQHDSWQFLVGLAHFAVSVGSENKVNEMTEMFRKDGYIIAGEPRRTGDGYYESIVLDPDGNRIEITT